ncbi:hypothetical protein [Saccharopolyspora sp. ASAGF58]|uniref:hypothetical protein n=1 Tax=Saccharopolyspora sp. ASAGF58 TaxID=2719023 RepID=UPI00143FC31E|nr:hypothetical protein [Saccharopolyspora sp. ASAGF58]QIZ35551.1 hypothetical protein FDZ84_13675 [Saccharopolyspora sp. ASAGF58]
MSRIGITGHSNLSAASVPLVLKALESELSAYSGHDLVGVSCLARGADQVFAHAVLSAGGTLEVVLPAADYRERKVKADNAAEFDELISKAAKVHTMPFAESNRDAYMGASDYILDSVEAMFAVWDGQPAGGRGGTGDVVDAARERGLPIIVVWPDDAERV